MVVGNLPANFLYLPAFFLSTAFCALSRRNQRLTLIFLDDGFCPGFDFVRCKGYARNISRQWNAASGFLSFF